MLYVLAVVGVYLLSDVSANFLCAQFSKKTETLDIHMSGYTKFHTERHQHRLTDTLLCNSTECVNEIRVDKTYYLSLLLLLFFSRLYSKCKNQFGSTKCLDQNTLCLNSI